MEGRAQFPEACEQGKRSDFILSIAEGNDFLKEDVTCSGWFYKKANQFLLKRGQRGSEVGDEVGGF